MKKSFKKILVLLIFFQLGLGVQNSYGQWHILKNIIKKDILCSMWGSPRVSATRSRVCKGQGAIVKVRNDWFANRNTFVWYDQNRNRVGFGRNLLVAPNQTTTYYCYGVHRGCSNLTYLGRVRVTVTDPNPPIPISSRQIVIESGQTANTNFPSGYRYSWSHPSHTAGAVSGDAAGSGANISQRLVNHTNRVQVVTYVVTPTQYGCRGNPFTVKVTIYPVPKIPNFRTLICKSGSHSITPVNGIRPPKTVNDGNSPFDPNTIVPGNEVGLLAIPMYSWDEPVVSDVGVTGGIASSLTSTINYNLVNNTSSRQTAVYTITPVTVYFSQASRWFERQVNGIPFTLTVDLYLEAPIISANIYNTSICEGETVTLKVSGNAETYQWSTGETGTEIDVSPETSSAFYVTGRINSNHCGASLGPINVKIKDVDAGPDKTICKGDEVLLEAVTEEVSPNSLMWSPVETLSKSNGVDPIAFPTETTVYTARVACKDGFISDDVTVFVDPLPEIIHESEEYKICRDQSVVMNTEGEGTFLWEPAIGLNSAMIASPTASPNVSIRYKVSLTDPSTGCTNKSAVDVLVNTIDVSLDATEYTIQKGNEVQLRAQGTSNSEAPIIYSWQPATGLNDPTDNSPIAHPLVSTTYSIMVTSAGCPVQKEVLVNVVNPPIAVFTYIICDNDVFFYTNNDGDYDYQWDFGDGSTTEYSHVGNHYDVGGTYKVCLTVSNEFSEESYCNKIYVQE